MANTITTNKVVDWPRNVVLDIHISGDNSGDESDYNLVDVSTFSGFGDWSEVKIMEIQSNLDGFAVQLNWDATADVEAVRLLNGASFYDWSDHGGLINNSGSGKTGDIKMVTSGLGAEDGSIILKMKKRG